MTDIERTASSPSRRAVVLALAALSVPSLMGRRAHAALARPAALTPEDQSELVRVQNYLDGIRTMQSRFQQYSQEGGIATGTIYLERPGKMRIVYDDPVPILIVSNGETVYYWDKKLEQLSQTTIDETPAWFLLRPHISLSGDVTVTGFEHSRGAIRIAMTETKHPDNGNLTLAMNDRPLELKQWTVVDAQQRPITVTLEDPHFGVSLSSALFIWTSQVPGAMAR